MAQSADFFKIITAFGSAPYSPVIVANIGTVTAPLMISPASKMQIRKTVNTRPCRWRLTGFVLPIVKPFGVCPSILMRLALIPSCSAHKYPGLSQLAALFLRRIFEKI